MIWRHRLDKILTTSRLVRRVIIDYDLPAGWPVKWGGQWDIAINGKLVPTGMRCLCWTTQEWINFITKKQNDGISN